MLQKTLNFKNFSGLQTKFFFIFWADFPFQEPIECGSNADPDSDPKHCRGLTEPAGTDPTISLKPLEPKSWSH
jgi:hypothetical protein